MRARWIVLFVAVGCGGSGADDAGGGADSGVDAGVDAGMRADMDAGVDASIAPDAGRDVDAGPSITLAHDFPEHTITSGAEVLGLCTSWTLANDSELFINTVELAQGESLRSSMWFFVPDTAFAGADGDWSCGDRSFSMAGAIAAGGGLLFRQSVDASADTQAFGAGVAIRIPPHARLVGVLHGLNTSGTTTTGHTTLTLHTIAAATSLLDAVLLSYDGLRIPPSASSRFSAACTVALTRVHYIQPNARSLATRVFANVLGGPDDGVSLLYASPFAIGVPSGVALSPPADLGSATGVSFGCEYANPRSTTVRWGYGDQEQCDVLAFVEAPAGALGSVIQANPMGMSGSLMLFDGPCGITTF